MTSNVTTTAFMPIPDYVIAQDLYLEIDKLETRISLITEAVKVVGVYNSSEDGIKRMMTEAVENDLIPVNQWAAFAEKGGIQGAIDWMPIAEIADVLSKLVERRNDVKALLYEINGISDIMRGAQAAGGAVSATERALEARFSSVRIQALQDEFAKYATDLIRLRAEVVAKHFQPESIVKQSNVEFLPDKDLIQPALNLIKNDPRLIWRIQVKPESVAMVDYAQLKQERTDYITALATYFQSAAPLIQLEPEVTPVLLELLKWGMAGFKGSNEVEGILDQAIQQMQQAKSKGGEENKEPSPEQIKAEAEQRKIQAEQQKQKVDQDFEREKWQYDQKFAQMEARLNSMEIKAKLDADLQKEAAQASFNIQEEQNETVESIKREEAKADLTMEVDDNRTRNTEREHDD